MCQHGKCSLLTSYLTIDQLNISKHTATLDSSSWFLCEDEKYLLQAISMKPKGIFLTREVYNKYRKSIECPYIIISDPWTKWAEIAALSHPSRPRFICGVTGTNGKTSVAYIAYQLFKLLGINSGYIGTNGVVPDVGINNPLTTPDASDLHMILERFSDHGVTHVTLEISSSGLQRQRASQLVLDCAVLTSFSQDHLDIHGTMENYWNTKLSIVNLLVDSSNFIVHESLRERMAAANIPCRLYKRNDKYKNKSFISFMEDNLAASCMICEVAGFDPSEIQGILSNAKLNVPGRMQIIHNEPTILVDFAHTPAALEALLRTFVGKKRLVIFGCGGNRDQSKRSIMGRVASANAEIVVITDDNPRNEDPAEIRSQVMSGCPEAVEIPCRKDAIRYGIEKSKSEDFVCIIAGKGHESWQIYGDTHEKFCDTEVVQEILQELHLL